jgi:hypothetical protein
MTGSGSGWKGLLARWRRRAAEVAITTSMRLEWLERGLLRLSRHVAQVTQAGPSSPLRHAERPCGRPPLTADPCLVRNAAARKGCLSQSRTLLVLVCTGVLMAGCGADVSRQENR